MSDQVIHESEKRAPVVPIGSSEAPATPSGWGAFVVRHKDYAIERLDGPMTDARAHVFADLESLAAWLTKHASSDVAEILFGKGEVRARLSRGVNAEVVRARLPWAPEWVEWSRVCQTDTPLSQRELLRFLVSVAPTLGAQAEVLIGAAQRLRLIAKDDTTVEYDVTGVATVRSEGRSTDLTFTVPSRFTIRVPVFEGVTVHAVTPAAGGIEIAATRAAEYDAEVLLEIEEDGAGFSLRMPTMARVLERARLDAAAHLRRLLGGAFLVGMGELEVRTVPDAEVERRP